MYKFLLTSVIALSWVLSQAQVTYRLEYNPVSETYTLSIRSQMSYSGPMSRITNSSQVTIVAPDPDGTGPLKFNPTNLTGLQPGASPLAWTFTQLNSPSQNPSKDYIFFAPTNSGTYTLFNIPANTWLPLFSFKSADGCTGVLKLYDNNAPASTEPMNGQGTYNTKHNFKTLGGGNVNLWHANEDNNASCLPPAPVDHDNDGVLSDVDPDDNNPCVPVSPSLNPVSPVQTACPVTSFNLATLTVDDQQNTTGTLSYYTTQADAQAATNALTNTTITSSGTYWIRKTTAAGCFSVTSVQVTIPCCTVNCRTILYTKN